MKQEFKVFLKNCIFGELAWLVFNTFFFGIYLYIQTLPKYSYLVPTSISFNKTILFYLVVYIIGILLVLIVSVLLLKKMANTFLTILSILFFRLIELIVLGIFISVDDSLIAFVNWSVASLEYLLIYVLGIRIPDINTLYYLTSFVPFIAMICGLSIKTQMDRKKTQGDSSSVSS